MFLGCSESKNPSDKHIHEIRSTIESESVNDTLISLNAVVLDSLPERTNHIDTNGLRQGKWIRKWKGHIIDIKNYKNDTLHGLYQHLDGIPYEVNYVMGKKEGFSYSYYLNPKRILMVNYYENDSNIWGGFPAANENFLTPVKHFRTNRDSIYIRAPYENGSLWYEGYFCLRPSEMNMGRLMTYCYGEHRIYHRNGRLRGIVDYTNESIQEYDSLGKVLYTAKFEEYDKHNQPLSKY